MNQKTINSRAMELIKRDGLINLSRNELCEDCGIAVGSFQHVMGVNFSDFVQQLADAGHLGPINVESSGRSHPGIRRAQLLSVAVDLAKTKGYGHITRGDVAEAAGVSMGLISRYFGTMEELRDAVMVMAIEQKVSEIIVQGLAANDPTAQNAPKAVKAAAVKTL